MKRALSLLFGLVMVFVVAGAVRSDPLNARDYNAPQPRPVLYSNSRCSGNASVDSTEFTATDGSGTTIRVWFENHENSSVAVRLYKYGWFGLKSNVLKFDVSGNDSDYKEYTASRADTGKYYINVQASDGGDISGYLRANQIP